MDVLFRSLAQEFGINGVAVIMTGMGEDGADALGAVKSAGGLTLAQDEASCVVYGMPRVARREAAPVALCQKGVEVPDARGAQFIPRPRQ